MINGYYSKYASIFLCIISLAGAVCGSCLRASADDVVTTVDMELRTLRFRNGVNGFEGAREIGIDKKKPGATSASQIVFVNRQKDDEGQQVLVQFRDIIGGRADQVPPGVEVVKAVLRIYSGRETSRHRVFFHRMLVPWKDNATWNSAEWGGDGIRMDGRIAVATADANNIFFNKNQYYDVDVTKSLRAWVAGAPNYGWVLHNTRTQSDPYGYCSSRMGTKEQRPELIVTFDADPSNTAPRVNAVSAAVTKSRTTGDVGASLNLLATDTDNDSLNVVFHGRRQADAAPDYSIILLPDTQYYTRERFGGTVAMLSSQIDWIVDLAKRRNIACVLHLGDISDQGDVDEMQWKRAAENLFKLENAAATGLPQGIPYCLAVGNHDQKNTAGDGGSALLFNKYFGVSHFAGKNYYGGHYGNNNNSYYVLFDAGPEKCLALSLEYGRPRKDADLLHWADMVLKKHADRRAFVITHFSMEPGLDSPLSPDGGAIHEALKGNPNLMIIAGGHVTGEGRRSDVYKGNTVYTIVQDFQFDGDGGKGFLGIMTLSPRQNRIYMKTYSPFLNEWRTDGASEYVLEYDFGTKPEKFAEIGRVNARTGEPVKCVWNNLKLGSGYEWYAEVSDRKKTTKTEPRAFWLRTASSGENAGK